MDDLILCVIIFVIVFLLRLSAYKFSKRKKKNKGIMMEMQYLINRFNLDKNKIDNYSIASVMCFLDGLIVSLALFLSIKLSNNTAIEILIAFVLIFSLIILFNEMIGRVLKKKGYDKK